MSGSADSTRIKAEADEILHDVGHLATLGAYGKPTVVGSCALNLMVWRDLDVYLEVERLDPVAHFDLAKRLVALLKPYRMVFRDETQTQTAGLPRGLYWGIYSKQFFKEDWKMAVWVMEHGEALQHLQLTQRLKKELVGSRREAALRLKNSLFSHYKYRREFFSLDIYEAVLDGVETEEAFREWLHSKRGIQL